jgi:hypothetical protein
MNVQVFADSLFRSLAAHFKQQLGVGASRSEAAAYVFQSLSFVRQRIVGN